MSRCQQAILAELSRLIDHDKILRATVQELTERLTKVEEDAKPPEPFVHEPFQKPDIYRNMAPINHHAIEVGNEVLAGIREDAHKPSPLIPRSMAAPTSRTATEPVQARGSGWQDQKALTPPPGLRWVEQQLDAQDAQDRAEANERANRAANLSKPLPPPKPKQLDTADLDAIMSSDKPAGGTP